MDLSKLADPFPEQDIEWRVSRAGISGGKTFCLVLAYITARAIQKRLDDVCGPANWRLEEPRMLDVNGKSAFACGISIRVGDDAKEWITKWDVSEPTNVEPAKGGFSGAMKRAGAQWGIGRYLYHLDETFADTAEQSPDKRDRRWKYAKLPEKSGGSVYYWKAPGLPGWALPKECEITKDQLVELVTKWREKFAQDVESSAERQAGFARMVHSLCGEFPVADRTCWTREAWEKCLAHVDSTTDPGGPSADVPFEE